MPLRKKTLRRMPPETRKVAKLVNDLASVERRLKNLLPTIQRMEVWERADLKRQAAQEESQRRLRKE